MNNGHVAIQQTPSVGVCGGGVSVMMGVYRARYLTCNRGATFQRLNDEDADQSLGGGQHT